MPRRPEPWYWTARKGWYVQIDGKQTLLGKAERKTGSPPVEVQREWHRIMATEDRLEDRELRRLRVPELIEVFLGTKQRLRPSTLRKYQFILEPFAMRYENRRPADLRPDDVLNFCEGQGGWGEASRCTCVSLVKLVWRFARERGLLDANPMAGLENPYHIPKRGHAMTEEEYHLIRDLGRDREWRFLVDALWHTGARPGELSKIEARHLDPVEPKATLAAHEHKTGRKSGRSRVIFFPDDIMAELRRLAMERPEGPLLRNSKGTPWKSIAIACRLMRWRKQGKIRKGLVLYNARHGFVTRKINEGHSPSLVSRAVGHATSQVTEGVYYNPSSELLGGVARNDIRRAVEEEKSRTGAAIDVDRLVREITEGIVAKLVVNSPPVSDT